MMKIEKRVWFVNAAFFTVFCGVWYFSLALYYGLIGCLIELADLRADPNASPGVYDSLCGSAQWGLAWAIGFGAPVFSLAALAWLVSRRRSELGWISVLAIHFLAAISMPLIHLTAFIQTTWALWN